MYYKPNKFLIYSRESQQIYLGIFNVKQTNLKEYLRMIFLDITFPGMWFLGM